MEQGLGFNSNSNTPFDSIDKSRVLDVKPLKFIVPIFPNSPPFPPEVGPFYPFIAPNTTQKSTVIAQTPQPNGGNGPLKDAVSNSGKRRGRPPREKPENVEDDFGVNAVIDTFLKSFNLHDFEEFKRRNNDNRGIIGTVLFVYDSIRRHLTQLEESKHLSLRRPDLKAGAALISKGIRANSTKRIGNIPGVEVGDIFFFRMELCIVGLHAHTMGGIDYTTAVNEESSAVSIVSSGGYGDNDNDNEDVLIYTGQGGVQRRDGRVFDQKLEGGNLALVNSFHRGNEVRVIRGVKDKTTDGSNGKIYVYDGLYQIQDSWTEKIKSGFSVFKYKLVRVPGQPEGFSLWKSIRKKDGNALRAGLVGECRPVALVNDVDGEMFPAHFTYVRSLRYAKPFQTSKPYSGCRCSGGCQPGDASCPCNRKNDGFAPYSSIGVLLNPPNKWLIHECGFTCSCPPNCRNRMSQIGVKVRFEVFKTKNKGWGLRSLDPIRAGGFICEYAGDVIEGFTENGVGNEIDDDYIFDATRVRGDGSGGSGKDPFALVISAKENGNAARFLNHSCCPNVMWRPVLRESNSDSYVHVAFFAIRHIPPMRELTYDYGMVRHEKQRDERKKKCLCGSTKCRGHFY
ncbi:hypothetical protein ACP275_10G155700 [Erythranthe tilingii]